MAPKLTIGMATYQDFDGVYFTLQSLRMFHDVEDVEFIVVDNFGCDHTKNFVQGWVKGRYILHRHAIGTSAPRDLVFREATGDAVMCVDSHIMFEKDAIAKLKKYYADNPGTQDLLQGPLVYDDLKSVATHFNPEWRAQMWGTWGVDPRGLDPNAEPFEIPMQGLGVFSCRREAWLGFNERFRGFGGEEGYIHQKYRNAGHKALCLPFLRWIHRFGRPGGVKYPLNVDNKIRNYLIGHEEVGLPLQDIYDHFLQFASHEKIEAIADEALDKPFQFARK